MSSFQDFVNRELPRRPVALTDLFVSYDGNPNLPAAPADLQSSPVGSVYVEPTTETVWRKAAAGSNTWVPSPNGREQTLEDFTVALSSGGEDPPPGYSITDQDESDAWGAFATPYNAVAALPPRIVHLVDIQFPDGNWLVDSNGIGDFTKFRRIREPASTSTAEGGIRFSSLNDWAQETGTPASMAVTSSDGAGNVTLAADPGLTADAFKTSYLLVLSGTGAGQYKPIRAHTGAAFSVCGGYAPALDATSTVQIVKPAAAIQIPPLGFSNESHMKMNGSGVSVDALVDLSRIDVVGGDYAWIKPLEITIRLGRGCRLVDGAVWAERCKVLTRDCVVDTRGNWYGYSGFYLKGGELRVSLGSSAPMFLLGASYAGQPAVVIWEGNGSNNASGNADCTIFGAQQFDDWAESFLRVRGGRARASLLVSGGYPRANNTPGYAIQAQEGGKVSISSIATWAATAFVGTTDDISIDGVGIGYSDIDADADEVAIGAANSIVEGS